MLGSHDACAYGITRDSKPNTLEPDNPVNNPIIYNSGRGICVRFAKAQMDDLYTQLNYGVRYLDFRNRVRILGNSIAEMITSHF